MNTILSLAGENYLGTIGILAAITSIVVQVLKNVLPKKFPTKILTIIIAVAITVGYVIGFGTISITSIIFAIFGGLVVAFASMYGFDNLKETINRFKDNEKEE